MTENQKIISEVNDLIHKVNGTNPIHHSESVKSYDDCMIQELIDLYNGLKLRSDKDRLMEIVRLFCSKPIF